MPSKERYARLQADPVRYQEYLAKRRMEYQSSAKLREQYHVYSQTPKRKETLHLYTLSPKGKESKYRYRTSEKGKAQNRASARRRSQTERFKELRFIYYRTDEYRAARRARQSTDEYKAQRYERDYNRRIRKENEEWLQHLKNN